MKQITLNRQIVFVILSFLIVAFGQPAWASLIGLLASTIGFGIFWRVLLLYPPSKARFWLASSWFFGVQLVQLSWFTSHPYSYIYIVYLALSCLWGLQFGLLSHFVRPQYLTLSGMLGLAGLWTIFEWSRLFFMSGFSWNPVGMTLVGNYYSLQFASFWGIFGLSFWVMFVNFLAVKAWIQGKKSFLPWASWVIAALIPYAYGYIQVKTHEQHYADHSKEQSNFYNAMLVQPAFPAEETLGIPDRERFLQFITEEWRQILKITKQHLGENIDLIALPEATVPFGAFHLLFSYDEVLQAFTDILGQEAANALPPLELPLAERHGREWKVNNAFWAQGIANAFKTDLVIGLEDAEDVQPKMREFYSSALFFRPMTEDNRSPENFLPDRYAKQVLVPMAEYIPFAFCRVLAAQYGIVGSFTCGRSAKIWGHEKLPFGVTICYEETFGNLMRENRQKGAQLLVNLTSDVWFPNSRLPRQHLEHARVRAVEMGIPLIRACNTGVTAAIDSFGSNIAILGNREAEREWLSDALLVKVPTYAYRTLYTHMGDWLIIGLSVLCVGFAFLRNRTR